MAKSPPRNALYAQSGGVSAVINATAAGVIDTARRHRRHIGKVFAGRHGIVGALEEDLIDVSKESPRLSAACATRPPAPSARPAYKLKKHRPDSTAQNTSASSRSSSAHDIGYFFYNGGNDSMDTCPEGLADRRAAGLPAHMPSACPRPSTTTCRSPTAAPGSGRWPSTSRSRPARRRFDVASMARTSTKVFVLEVMGRHAGWIAAAGGLAGSQGRRFRRRSSCSPRSPFEREKFLARVKQCVKDQYGYCVDRRVGGRGKTAEGKFLADAGTKDAFGHTQLGGVGPVVANMVKRGARLQVPLGGGRLPAARRAPHRLEGRRRAGLCGRQGGGGTRGQRATTP